MNFQVVEPARCKLHSVYDRKKTKWIAKLQQVKWISDTRSAHKRAYMGVTIHCVCPNSNTLQLKSVALACRCFAGAHTGDAIRQKLASIFQEFQI